jgi:Predicted transcriptional regulators
MINQAKEQEIFYSKACESTLGSGCYVEKALTVLGGKWAYLIIKHLFADKKRFGELRKLLHGVNARSLTMCLRNLEEQGIVTRTVIPTVPVTVEYSLTEKGRDLRDVIAALYLFGEKWKL